MTLLNTQMKTSGVLKFDDNKAVFGGGIAMDDHCLVMVIRCNACKKDIGLHRKNVSPYLISNWTRHIKVCKKLKNKASKLSAASGKVSHC